MAKVMIIDDEQDIRDLVDLTLSREGYDVITAEDGESALEALSKEKPDLVLLDINMPGIDGWETLDRMEKKGITKDVPVMMFTIEELTFVKMLREDIEGLVGYMEKPFDRSELVDTVTRIIKETKKISEQSKRIRERPEGGENMADAFESLSRSKMIHERFLDKLREMEKNLDNERKLAQLKNLKRGEKNTIDDLERKRERILNNLDIDES
ncbi:MAG: response regulator [Candidatus Hadarchaeia archaeon]